MDEKGLYYTKTHEWLHIDGENGTIGITDYAQEHLTDIVFVEFPDVDAEFNKGDVWASLDSVKAAGDIYTPVDMKVVEVHSDLEDNWHNINEDPYGDGWLIKVKILKPEQVNELMNFEQYQEFLKTQ